MSFIFDRFPAEQNARDFIGRVEIDHPGIGGLLFTDEAEAFEHDPFPFELVPPIVHIDRPDDPDADQDLCNELCQLVDEFNGAYAGT